MPQAPPGIEILGTRKTDSSRVHYEARQVQLNRPVLLVGLAPGVLSSSPLSNRLEAEAKVLADLDHPNVVRLFDYVRHDDDLWLILEDIDGPNLSELVGKGVPWPVIAAVGLDLCRALTHAHRMGHQHGSLTISAVQFSRSGRTKLAGFGRNLAQQSDRIELLDTESRGGLSPETSIGQALSPVSDIFALGALLYELASGRAPFGDVGAIDYPTRVRNQAHEPLVKVAPHLPHALTSLIEQMMEKMPANRPANAASIAEQLEALIGGTTLSIIATSLRELGFNNVDPPARAASLVQATPTQMRSQNVNLVTVGVAAALVLAGVIFSVFLVSRKGSSEAPKAPAQLTDLNQALHLRVVASPWAHVLVDGVLRETTPFAYPIELSPGSHVVRLEHPNAPAEERTITGAAGQVVLLNVQMHVKVELPSSILVGDVEESSP